MSDEGTGPMFVPRYADRAAGGRHRAADADPARLRARSTDLRPWWQDPIVVGVLVLVLGLLSVIGMVAVL